MQSLSKSDEQILLDGVKQAVDLVDNSNMSPNEALQKVAQELQYSPGFLKSACNAFNNGRQLAQWKANDNVLDKLASFPLADYSTIHEAIWGDKAEKIAEAKAFFSPRFASYEDEARQDLLHMDIGSFTKAAADESSHDTEPGDAYQAELQVKLAFNRLEWERRQAAEARRLKVAAEDQLNLKVHLLENYFKKFSYDRLPLAQVEDAAAAYYGKPGVALMGYVASKFPKEKRASDHHPNWSGFSQPVNRNAEPYTLISACIKQAQVRNQMERWLLEAEEKLAEAELGVENFTQPRTSDNDGSPATLTPSLIEGVPGKRTEEKKANILGGLAGGVGLGLAKNIVEDEDYLRKKEIEDQIGELDSPEHLNELRKIRAMTALTQMISDPENPLSEYDPEEVLSAYNELVQLSPRIADQPAAFGPLLQKRLMGNTEPFEIAEQIKMEQGLQKTQATPSESRPVERSQPSLLERMQEGLQGIEPALDKVVDPAASVTSKGLQKLMPSGDSKSKTDLMKNEASILS